MRAQTCLFNLFYFAFPDVRRHAAGEGAQPLSQNGLQAAAGVSPGAVAGVVHRFARQQRPAGLVDQLVRRRGALCATFTQEQHALFDVFEDARNASAAAYQEALARQALLLAREIYR